MYTLYCIHAVEYSLDCGVYSIFFYKIPTSLLCNLLEDVTQFCIVRWTSVNYRRSSICLLYLTSSFHFEIHGMYQAIIILAIYNQTFCAKRFVTLAYFIRLFLRDFGTRYCLCLRSRQSFDERCVHTQKNNLPWRFIFLSRTYWNTTSLLYRISPKTSTDSILSI
jgi:hypothetical protein